MDVRNLLPGEGTHLRVLSVPAHGKEHGVVRIMHECMAHLLHGEGVSMLLDMDTIPSGGWDERVLDELRDAEKKDRHVALTALTEGADMCFPTWQPYRDTVLSVQGRRFARGNATSNPTQVLLATPMVCVARSRLWRQAVPVAHPCVALALSASLHGAGARFYAPRRSVALRTRHATYCKEVPEQKKHRRRQRQQAVLDRYAHWAGLQITKSGGIAVTGRARLGVTTKKGIVDKYGKRESFRWAASALNIKV